VILGPDSNSKGKGEGSGGVGGGDEPMESKPEPSESKREEDNEEEEGMDDPNLEWMTEGPLALLVVLHNTPMRLDRMDLKFDPNTTVKKEYHLDKFYL